MIAAEPPKGLYVKLYLSALDDEDTALMSFPAVGLWTVGLMLAKRSLSDGQISKALLRKEARGRGQSDDEVSAIAAELIEAGVWSDDGDSYTIRNWLKYNRSAEEIDTARKGKSSGGAKANHKRWHVGEKGRPSTKCEICFEEGLVDAFESGLLDDSHAGSPVDHSGLTSDQNPITFDHSDISTPSTESESESETESSGRTDRSDPPTTDRAPADQLRFDEAERLCCRLADGVAQWPPNSKRPKVTSAWVSEMERLIRIDGRDPNEVESLIAWLFASEHKQARFWAGNARCPDKLRSQYDRIRANRDQALAEGNQRKAPQQASEPAREAFAAAKSTYDQSRRSSQPGKEWNRLLEAHDPRITEAVRVSWRAFGTDRAWFEFRDAWTAIVNAEPVPA